MRGLVSSVVALSFIAVAIGGCGGGDGETTESTAAVTEAAPLTKEELIAQGDAICAEVNAAVGTVGSTSTGSEGQASQVADLYAGMAERLQGLGVPSDEPTGYDEFIGAAEQLAQAESDVALAAGRGEGEALAGAEGEADSARDAFQSAAQAYGLEQCAEAPSAPAVTAGGGGSGGGGEESSAGAAEEAAPEAEEAAPEETGGAGTGEEEGAGGGAAAGGGSEGSGGGSSGGIGPG